MAASGSNGGEFLLQGDVKKHLERDGNALSLVCDLHNYIHCSKLIGQYTEKE